MYKSLAMINGMLITIMILSNGLMVEIFGNTPSVLANHLIGLTAICIVITATKEKWVPLKGIPLFFLIGGITGIANVYLTNISFLTLGATVTVMLSMVSQMMSSTVIDHYGFFGRTKYPFIPQKLIGISMIVAGMLMVILL